MRRRSRVRELTEDERQNFKERRREKRVPCNIDLRVATYDGVTPPEQMDYLAMESRDISASGISFFAPKPPETDQIVMMIGDYRDAYFVTARVAWYAEGYYNRRHQFTICDPQRIVLQCHLVASQHDL